MILSVLTNIPICKPVSNCGVTCLGSPRIAIGCALTIAIRASRNPRLNLSSERYGADQGERYQDGGEEAEETTGDLGFS